MLTFETEAQAHAGLRKVGTESEPVTAAAAGWIPTRNGLFARFLIADDFQQPIFELPATEFKDIAATIAKAPVRTMISTSADTTVISKPAVTSATVGKGSSEIKLPTQMKKSNASRDQGVVKEKNDLVGRFSFSG